MANAVECRRHGDHRPRRTQQSVVRVARPGGSPARAGVLSYSDSLRVYVNGQGQRETTSQHRICWARTAGIAAVPVWFDATTVASPRDATLLQRG